MGKLLLPLLLLLLPACRGKLGDGTPPTIRADRRPTSEEVTQRVVEARMSAAVPNGKWENDTDEDDGSLSQRAERALQQTLSWMKKLHLKKERQGDV